MLTYCSDCKEVKQCEEIFDKYYCKECNEKAYEKIDKNMKTKGVKIDNFL